MFPQFGRTVGASVMMILVALFTWIYHQNRRQRERLWMIGWAAIFVHFLAALLESYSLVSNPLGDFLTYGTLIAAAASFCLSVCPGCASSRFRAFLFFLLLIVPALIYAACLAFGNESAPLYATLLALMLAGVFSLALKFLFRSRPLGWAVALLAITSAAWAAYESPVSPEYGLYLFLFGIFASTAYLYWRQYRRVTPGVTFTSFAFLMWGSVFPIGGLCAYLHLGIPDDNVLWDLPKYAVAFGMILTLFENQAHLLQIEIVERKRAEMAAQAASLAKSQFLAHMSHEIRTPMNGIIGMTDLLLADSLTARQREELGLVKESAESLLIVINDILDFSRIEAGRLTIEKIEFSLHQVVREVMSTIELRAKEKGLELSCNLEQDIPSLLLGDALRLRQVLVNLLGNAVKFTEQGSVLLRIEQAQSPSADHEAVLRFAVIDTGIGVPPEKRKVIFEPFRQADNSTARQFGGTGLGLAISAELVAMMGGTLTVADGPGGRGSIFSFDAHFELSQNATRDFSTLAAAVGVGSAVDLVKAPLGHSPFQNDLDDYSRFAVPLTQDRPLKILLAEDSRVNQLLATKLMRLHGHQVTLASTGSEVLDVLKEDVFDLVLMDVQMPGMDGIEATRRIRESETLSGLHIPIIAVTAHAMKGDEERCLSAGMDAYISKPINASELFGKIRELV